MFFSGLPGSDNTDMSLIAAKSLSKTYATNSVEVQALHDVSFEIQAGAFLAFVGPSGSGKTTLLNLIGCLDKPTSGSLVVAGSDVVQFDRRDAASTDRVTAPGR